MIDFSKLKNMPATKQYTRDAVVAKEGDSASNSMYIVLQGGIQLVKKYDKPDKMVIANLGPGDFFDEMSLFLLKQRAATAVAVEESLLLEVSQDNVYDLFNECPQLVYSVIRALCSRIDELNDLVRSG